MRLLFELHKIWSVDSQENCGGAAGRLNSGRLEHTPKDSKVPATGSLSNPETVGDLMGEVRARCIEALSATMPPWREVHPETTTDCRGLMKE